MLINTSFIRNRKGRVIAATAMTAGLLVAGAGTAHADTSDLSIDFGPATITDQLGWGGWATAEAIESFGYIEFTPFTSSESEPVTTDAVAAETTRHLVYPSYTHVVTQQGALNYLLQFQTVNYLMDPVRAFELLPNEVKLVMLGQTLFSAGQP